jgi:hypothetical protein
MCVWTPAHARAHGHAKQGRVSGKYMMLMMLLMMMMLLLLMMMMI